VEPELQEDDQEGEAGAEGETEEGLGGNGEVVPPRPAEGEDDQGAEQDELHGGAFRGRFAVPTIDDENEAEGFIGAS